MPLLRPDELVGLLLIGPKTEAGSCSDGELELLRLLAAQLAVVVEELEGGRAPGTDHLLTAAAAALYQAKRDGRDRAVFLAAPTRLVTGATRRKDQDRVA